VKELLCAALNLYLLVLVARAILSWFPSQPGTGLATFQQILAQLTEPVVAPVRRVIPPAGMLDLSFLVVFFVLLIVLRLMQCPASII
jgi:YggT family protein